MNVRNIFFILISIFWAFNAKAQLVIMTKESDSLVKVGADYIYNIEFDKATQCFTKVITNEPKNPAGYFLQCMVEWWKIQLFSNTQIYDQGFLNQIEKVLNICENNLKNINIDDISTKDESVASLFFKGAALGYRARFYTNRDQYFKSANDGYDAYKIMLKCHELAPGNHDIMLGTGLYNFLAVAIPEKYPLLKPVVALFPEGNKRLGILQLRATSLYSRYTSVEAKVALLQIFESFDIDYNEALNYSKMLYSAYPKNPYFYRHYATNLIRMNQWDSAEYHWREIVKKCLNREVGFDNKTGREGCYYVGIKLMNSNDLKGALKYLLKCEEISNYIEKEPTTWLTSTDFKIGIVYDRMGDRKKALEYYNKVLKLPDFQESHEQAKRYISIPAR